MVLLSISSVCYKIIVSVWSNTTIVVVIYLLQVHVKTLVGMTV